MPDTDMYSTTMCAFARLFLLQPGACMLCMQAGTYRVIRGCVQNPTCSIYGEWQDRWTVKRAVIYHLTAKSLVWQIKVCRDLARPMSGWPCCFKIPPPVLPQKYKPVEKEDVYERNGSQAPHISHAMYNGLQGKAICKGYGQQSRQKHDTGEVR